MTRRRTDDPAQADRAWAGYHPRAAIPAFVLAGIASLLVWTGRWYLDDLSDLADRIGGLALFALAWCVWPALIAVYLYRTVTYTYRLTDRAVLIDFGFWHNPVPPVRLEEITEVRVATGRRKRWLGVGWIEVRTADRVARLVGVRHADHLAEQIRVAASTARAGSANDGK